MNDKNLEEVFPDSDEHGGYQAYTILNNYSRSLRWLVSDLYPYK